MVNSQPTNGSTQKSIPQIIAEYLAPWADDPLVKNSLPLMQLTASAFTIGGAVLSYYQQQAIQEKLDNINQKLDEIKSISLETLALVKAMPQEVRRQLDYTERKRLFENHIEPSRIRVNNILAPYNKARTQVPSGIEEKDRKRIAIEANEIAKAAYAIHAWGGDDLEGIAYTNRAMMYAYSCYLFASKIAGEVVDEQSSFRAEISKQMRLSSRSLLLYKENLLLSKNRELAAVDGTPRQIGLGGNGQGIPFTRSYVSPTEFYFMALGGSAVDSSFHIASFVMRKANEDTPVEFRNALQAYQVIPGASINMDGQKEGAQRLAAQVCQILNSKSDAIKADFAPSIKQTEIIAALSQAYSDTIEVIT